MAIPTVITDLSATIASNSPAGGDQAFPNIDDYLRAAYGFIRQGDTKASDIASAGTVDLGAAVGRIVDVTGTTTITSFGTVAAGIWRIVRFTGALTLTHNATSLILPGAANITTAAGDTCVAVSLGSGNWVVTQYQRAAVEPVAANVISGTWTPTLTPFLNVDAVYHNTSRYIRVGDVVQFVIYMSIDVTASSVITSVLVTNLPAASDFTLSSDAVGSAVIYNAGGGQVTAEPSNNGLLVTFHPASTSLAEVRASGMYVIK